MTSEQGYHLNLNYLLPISSNNRALSDLTENIKKLINNRQESRFPELDEQINTLANLYSRKRQRDKFQRLEVDMKDAIDYAQQITSPFVLHTDYQRFLSVENTYPLRESQEHAEARPNFYTKLVRQLREERSLQMRKIQRQNEREQLEKLQLLERQKEVAEEQRVVAQQLQVDYIKNFNLELQQKRMQKKAAEQAAQLAERNRKMQLFLQKQRKEKTWKKLKYAMIVMSRLMKGGVEFRIKMDLEKRLMDSNFKAIAATGGSPLMKPFITSLIATLSPTFKSLNSSMFNVLSSESTLQEYELSVVRASVKSDNIKSLRSFMLKLFESLESLATFSDGLQTFAQYSYLLIQERKFLAPEFYPGDVLSRFTIDQYGRLSKLSPPVLKMHTGFLLILQILAFEVIEAMRELPKGSSRGSRFAFRIIFSLFEHIFLKWADRLVHTNHANQMGLEAKSQTAAMPPRRADPAAILPKSALVPGKVPPVYLDSFNWSEFQAFFADVQIEEFFNMIDKLVENVQPTISHYYDTMRANNRIKKMESQKNLRRKQKSKANLNRNQSSEGWSNPNISTSSENSSTKSDKESGSEKSELKSETLIK